MSLIIINQPRFCLRLLVSVQLFVLFTTAFRGFGSFHETSLKQNSVLYNLKRKEVVSLLSSGPAVVVI